jgi:hypothetical protein
MGYAGNPKGMLYIPQRVVLPGGFRIKVSQLRPMQMKTKYGQFLDGCWDADTKSLDVLRTLTHQRKWWVFSEQMAHVITSWQQELKDRGLAKA